MSDYDDAYEQYIEDCLHPKRFVRALPGVPIAQSSPAPINTTPVGIYQPLELPPIDGIITLDDAFGGNRFGPKPAILIQGGGFILQQGGGRLLLQ